MADKAQQSSGSDHALFVGAGLFLTFTILSKFEKWLKASLDHQILFAGIVGILIAAVSYWAVQKREIARIKRERDAGILGPEKNSVFCGTTINGEDVFIKTQQRTMHTQIIGTTNAGKTESVILPWAIQDIKQGRGLILIDGKADKSLLDKLWAYAVQSGRQKDFRLFSLSNIEESYQFNPLIGGTPEEVTERVFNAFEFENPYYRSVQFEVFSQVMRVFEKAKKIPTFLRLHQAMTNPAILKYMVQKWDKNDPLKQWVDYFKDLPALERAQRTSGLLAAISHFAFGKASCLFNTEAPEITLDKALSKNLIVYFQLPVLLSPFLGQASGKMILQCLQGAVANRHRSSNRQPDFFSVFLDDFTEYLYPGFVSILNKSRSANVGIVFAHQALGDIKTLGDPIANSILTNANLKVFMRGNDPDSTEYFSKVIGTSKTVKYTERTKTGFFAKENTGDASAREVEEFIIHPNKFKNELGVGEAMMVIPHAAGSKTVHIKFRKYDDIPAPDLIPVTKENAKPLELPVEQKNQNSIREENI
ncbi:MAG: TraM recognition domain-containing protein [Pseudomonadota bacterium]|nr:TraM recognition domain-containing protein [Pseudomonadota bacterium]